MHAFPRLSGNQRSREVKEARVRVQRNYLKYTGEVEIHFGVWIFKKLP